MRSHRTGLLDRIGQVVARQGGKGSVPAIHDHAWCRSVARVVSL
jgi:hypothetical protein